MKVFAGFVLAFILLSSFAMAVCIDNDEDGFVGDVTAGCSTQVDCDDTDEFVFPGAEETCDYLDNNCDGEVDEGCGALENGSSVNQTQEVPPDCTLLDAQWFDNAGESLDVAVEGDSVFLSTSTENCDGLVVSFVVVEFDGIDPETGDLLAEEVTTQQATITGNGAAFEWSVAYVDDDIEIDEQGNEDYYPEYLLFAAIESGDALIAAPPSSLLKVVLPEETFIEDELYYPEADVPQDTPAEFFDTGFFGDTSDVFAGSEDQGGFGESTRMPANPADVIECGNSRCENGESLESCPADCTDEGGIFGIVMAIFITLAVLVSGTIVGIKISKAKKNQSLQVDTEEEARKKAEIAVQNQQYYQQVAQGRVQMQQPMRYAQPQQPYQQPSPQPYPQQVQQPYPQPVQQQYYQQPVPSQQPPQQQAQERLQKAVLFAFNSRKQGMNPDQIKGLMLSVGFTEQEANYALNILQNTPA